VEPASAPGGNQTPSVGVTFASFSALGPEAGITAARWARDLGYRSFWVAETTGLEAFSTLAQVAATVGGLELGTGVLALQLRTPALAAMGAATLAAQHPDTCVHLGVGISSPVVVGRWHGATYSPTPLAQVREYAGVVRACWAGEAVTHDGDHYHLEKFRLGIRPSGQPPQLVLGALGPRMLHLAGEVADGVLLNDLPASAVAWSVEQVRAGERAAGRPPGSVRIHAYVHVGVTDRHDAADKARRDLFSYAVVDAYADAFTRAGFGSEVAAIRAAHRAGDRQGAVAAVSDTMVDAIDILGDRDTVADAVAAYLHAGVDEAVIMPLPWGDDRMAVVRDTLDAAAHGAASAGAVLA